MFISWLIGCGLLFSFLGCWPMPAKNQALIRNWTIKLVVFLARLRSCWCSFVPKHKTWCFAALLGIEMSCCGVLKASKAVVVTAVPKRGGFGPAFPMYCCWCSSNLFLSCPNPLTWHNALQVLLGWFSHELGLFTNGSDKHRQGRKRQEFLLGVAAALWFLHLMGRTHLGFPSKVFFILVQVPNCKHLPNF